MQKNESLLKKYSGSRTYFADDYRSRHRAFFQENRYIIFFSLFIFLAVLLIRSWGNFTHPGLYVEDSSHYFNYFYGDIRGLEGLLNSPNGYINLFTNMVAMLAAKLDVRLLPTIYLLAGAAMAILAVMALPVSGLINNKYILFISPFLLGLSGMNHIYYYITLTYAIYVAVILLFCLLFWQNYDSGVMAVLFFLLLSFLIWSGPYSVLIIPFSLLFIFFFKGKSKLMFGLMIVALFYLLSVSEKTIMLGNIFRPEIRKIWLDTLFLDVFLMGAREVITVKIIIALTLFFIGVICLLRKDYFYLKVAVLLLVIINGSLALLFLSKKYLLYQRVLPCHLFIPQFFWLFFLLFTADRFLSKSKWLNHLGLVFALFFVIFIVYDNRKNPEKWQAQVMTALPNFLQVVHDNEQDQWQQQNRLKIISTPGNGRMRPTAKVGRRGDEDNTEVEFIFVEGTVR